MVRRGPDGKFRSGGGGEGRDNCKVVTGSLTNTVPAADLSGGTISVQVDGEESEVFDFTQVLDSNEVFEAQVVEVTAGLHMPTTATAEGSAQLEWTARTGYGVDRAVKSAFYGNPAQVEDGVADINTLTTDADDVLTSGRLSASAGFGDSVNGLGAGAEHGFDYRRMPFVNEFGGGVHFDSDDELTIPHTVEIDNVSDHAVEAFFEIVMTGPVHGD